MSLLSSSINHSNPKKRNKNKLATMFTTGATIAAIGALSMTAPTLAMQKPFNRQLLTIALSLKINIKARLLAP